MRLAHNELQALCVCVRAGLTPFDRAWIIILLVLLQQLPHEEGIVSVGETSNDLEMS